ncbi:ArgR family transcriptional regulator [Vagococcus coleopterorum]|uniref:Arginine repressor n=1 Tax=Vagococcus coleopterorum TaxID=2714946 RepID=A0A6G8AKY3_9ENTE|nr:ArgR family transcriptional regulator [Vagococcus coleopterorum]QIL45718.1 ArgR family transcriptional regulator [Vagococcus coleopterorum]
MKKTERQDLVKQVVLQYQIETQDELLEKLKTVGVEATQATISRDMRELSIVKGRKDGSGPSHYLIHDIISVPQQLDQLAESVADSVEKITVVQFMVIIQTYLGSANMLAAQIDDMKLPEVAGTLAGANTLSIITHTNEEAETLAEQLSSYLK